MTGLFYSRYQMVCLFLLNIKKKKNILEKTRQDNVYLVFYTDNKYMNGSQRSLLVVFRISWSCTAQPMNRVFYLLNLLLSSQI